MFSCRKKNGLKIGKKKKGLERECEQITFALELIDRPSHSFPSFETPPSQIYLASEGLMLSKLYRDVPFACPAFPSASWYPLPRGI